MAREFAWYMDALIPGYPIIKTLARLLRRRRHAVIGAHARNAYVDPPRATVDLDVIVPRDKVESLIDALLVEHPKVRIVATRGGAVVQVRTRKDKVADLIVAEESQMTLAALVTASARPVPTLGRLKVPPIEVIAAMKCDSASDPQRERLRAGQDAVDAAFLLDRPHDPAAVEAALALAPARAARLYRKILRTGGRPTF